MTYKRISARIEPIRNPPAVIYDTGSKSSADIVQETQLTPLIFWEKPVARGKGECYITTSMWRVELMLEFNSFSSSSFLFRLVLQMFSVPFVA